MMMVVVMPEEREGGTRGASSRRRIRSLSIHPHSSPATHHPTPDPPKSTPLPHSHYLLHPRSHPLSFHRRSGISHWRGERRVGEGPGWPEIRPSLASFLLFPPLILLPRLRGEASDAVLQPCTSLPHPPIFVVLSLYILPVSTSVFPSSKTPIHHHLPTCLPTFPNPPNLQRSVGSVGAAASSSVSLCGSDGVCLFVYV